MEGSSGWSVGGEMRIFICSPYAGEVERNVQMARKLCRKAIEVGHESFAPTSIKTPLSCVQNTT
jgi:hypothetical protein